MANFSNWFHRQEELLEKAIAGLFYDPKKFAKEKTICMTPNLAQELLSAHKEKRAKESDTTDSAHATILENA